MSKGNIPVQWHLYIVDLEPRVGTKPGKQRPCVVVQPTVFGENGLESSVILPLTTKLTPRESFPLRVRFPRGTCGLFAESDVLINQVLSWDNSLFKEDLGEIPEALQSRVKEALREFLDF